jgi:hypothetical protein
MMETIIQIVPPGRLVFGEKQKTMLDGHFQECIVMTLPDFLTQDQYDYIHVTAHRVGLGDIVFFYRQGDSPEMLHARFPTIGLPSFYKIIAFYLENQLAVDEYCSRHAAEMARQRSEARPGPSMDELRRRSEANRVAPPRNPQRQLPGSSGRIPALFLQ